MNAPAFPPSSACGSCERGRESRPGGENSMEMADDINAQAEEAVALEAILGGDFTILTDSGTPIQPAQLTALFQGRQGQRTWAGKLVFEVLVKLQTPREGLPVELAGCIWTGHRILHLPPLLLKIEIPPTYPSKATPSIALDAWWLSSEQRAELEVELLKQSEAEQGSAVCFGLVSWLEASALQLLGMESVLTVPSDERPGNQLSDKATHVESTRCHDGSSDYSERILESLLCYNAFQDNISFLVGTAGSTESNKLKISQELGPKSYSNRLPMPHAAPFPPMFTKLQNMHLDWHTHREGIWTCKICLEEIAGSQCIRAAACRHIFCKKCIRQYCKTQLQEKRVDLLQCPDPQCNEALIRDRLKRLLAEKDVQHWEEVELQATLLKMADVVFCPRCSATCIEDSDNSALCPACHYSFCSLCQSGYHPGQRCMPIETKLRMLKQRMSGRKDGALLRELKRKEEDLLSISCIQEMSKTCPTCSAAISRTEGCNKMTCTYCGTYFCYTCGQRISGYDHFRAGSQCMLFDEEELRRWDQQFEPINMQEQERLLAEREVDLPVVRYARCRCGCLNSKLEKLNMLTCRGCSARYCYLCQTVLRKGEAASHFRPSGCKLHTND